MLIRGLRLVACLMGEIIICCDDRTWQPFKRLGWILKRQQHLTNGVEVTRMMTACKQYDVIRPGWIMVGEGKAAFTPGQGYQLRPIPSEEDRLNKR